MIKSVSNFIRRENKYLLFIFLLTMVNLLFLYDLHASRFSSGKLSILLVVVFINIILIGGYAFLFHKKRKIEVEKLYLIIMIPIGFFYLFLFPVNTIPDENTHFMRISEIASGHLVSKIEDTKGIQGRYFDSAIYSVLLKSTNYKKSYQNLKIKNTKEKDFYHFANTALYSFVCYLPQTVGFLFAKILHLPILVQIYMARLFNFLVYIFLTYFALKMMPIKKSALFMILFFPIVIQEAISPSPDSLTIATTTFFVSYVFHLKYKKNTKITKKEIGILSITSIVLSLCKIVYLPICLIIFLIPKEKFLSLRNKNITLVSIALIAVIVNLIWLLVSSKFLPKSSGINSTNQLHYIFSHLFQYGMTVFRTFSITGGDLVFNSIGKSLGCLNIGISELYIIPTIFLFLIAVLYDNNHENKIIIKNYERIWIGIIILGVVLLISTSLYLQWTLVGTSMISGIQGRYFIPLYFLLPFLFTKYKLSPKRSFLNKYIYLYFVAFNFYALNVIFYSFI